MINLDVCGSCSCMTSSAHILTVIAILFFLFWFILQSSDSDSQKNFPSKSCPLRYGTAKMQADAFNLFQAGLREYMGSSNIKAQGGQNNGWRITGLSISASKIVEIPSVSLKPHFHSIVFLIYLLILSLLCTFWVYFVQLELNLNQRL